MKPSDSIPNLHWLGIGGPFENFFDEEKKMVLVPEDLFKILITAESIDSLRQSLKMWFLSFVAEETYDGMGQGETEYFNLLDEWLIDLHKQVLYREFLKSHNIKPDNQS